MPKQSSKRVPGGVDLEYAENQPFHSSPTEGYASEDIESLELHHNEMKGLHDKGGKSVSPDANSDAARPLSKRTATTSGREVHPTDSKPAGLQRDFDSAGIGKEPKRIKRVGEEGEVEN